MSDRRDEKRNGGLRRRPEQPALNGFVEGIEEDDGRNDEIDGEQELHGGLAYPWPQVVDHIARHAADARIVVLASARAGDIVGVIVNFSFSDSLNEKFKDYTQNIKQTNLKK